ncbi:MAG: hypothetical protein ABFC38_12040 [Methanospirillum sp.]
MNLLLTLWTGLESAIYFPSAAQSGSRDGIVVRLRRGIAIPPAGKGRPEPEAGAVLMFNIGLLIDNSVEHQHGGSSVSEIADGGNCAEIDLLIINNHDHTQGEVLEGSAPTHAGSATWNGWHR